MAALYKPIPRRAELARAEVHHKGELVRPVSSAVGLQIRVNAQPGVVRRVHRTRVGGGAGHARLRYDRSGAFQGQVRAERGRGDIVRVVKFP